MVGSVRLLRQTLNGIYGAEFVRGFQGAGPVPPNSTSIAVEYENAAAAKGAGSDIADDNTADNGISTKKSGGSSGDEFDELDVPLLASSCAKHFFGYNLENCYTKGDNCRLNFNTVASEADISDTYLPQFKVAVQQGGVSGLMCECSSCAAI